MSENTHRHARKEDRVPRLYKEAKKIVQQVKEEGGSLKGLIYQSKKCGGRVKALYALVSETLRHGPELDAILRGSQLLLKERRLDAWLARVLITQLLWREQPLSSPAPPFKIILSYESELRALKEKLSSEVSHTVHQKRPRYVRINTLKTTEQEVLDFFVQNGWNEIRTKKKTKYVEFLEKVSSLSDRDFIRDAHIPNLLIFPGNMQFYDLSYYQDNYFILQDKASCMPAVLLDPSPGSTVLDMCAAPGMKTTHVAAMLNNTGTVYAIEKHPGRYSSLCKVISQTGATCVKTILGSSLDFTGSLLPDVEYILVDPSCSGTGMPNRQDIFHESNEIDEHRLGKLVGFQTHILRHAMTNFPNAKRIVYSTCSVCPEENEAVIQAVLNTTQNFKPILPNICAEWMHKGSAAYTWGEFGFYARPDIDLTNGFFVAVFERTENEYISGDRIAKTDECNDTRIKNKKKKKSSGTAPSQTAKNSSESTALKRMMKAMVTAKQSVNTLDESPTSSDNLLEQGEDTAKPKKKTDQSNDTILNDEEPVKKRKKKNSSM